MSDMFFEQFINFSRTIFGEGFVPLHRPIFEGNERQYLTECIDSNFVSSVGAKVEEFEQKVASFTGVNHAVATVNGTAALHVAIELVGVCRGDEVISQALTFIATCNAISYTGAKPVFIDVDIDTMGMSPESLQKFLDTYGEKRDGHAYNKKTGNRIAACIPMHTFGFPCRIEKISAICKNWNIPLVEDAAESLGSYVNDAHTGTFGEVGTLSFNGNKLITTGGGGMIITNNATLASRAKHITTTAKVSHAYEFEHDEIGYNYRMPNLNAALGCAQIERLPEFLEVKNRLAVNWANFFSGYNIKFVQSSSKNLANHWLNTLVFNNKNERDDFLNYTNENGVMTRPIWKLMSELPMFIDCQHDGLLNSTWLYDRVVNIPSSIPYGSINSFE